MIKAIINQYDTEISNLGFVERYGGLAYPVTKVVETDREKGTTKEIVFPVTCKINVDQCLDLGYYYELVPNYQFKSIFYWEQLSPLRPLKCEGPKGSLFVYGGQVRLVGWLNLQKLGISDTCGATCDFIATILNAGIVGERKINTDTLANATLVLDPPTITENDPSIFSKYTYYREIVKNLFLYPYEYFALDFNVKLTVPANCITAIETGDEINCINV